MTQLENRVHLVTFIFWSSQYAHHLINKLNGFGNIILVITFQPLAHFLFPLTLFISLGIGLSIDDFGTGYSNLAYLRLYPVDVLKIDITFVKDVHLDEKKQNLVRAIISMAQALGMKTIAEGVECQEELDFLVNEKCDQYQGFFFGKPVAEEKLIFNLTSL